MSDQIKAVLTACSDPVAPERQEEIRRLCGLLSAEGLEVRESPCLFQNDVFDERAKAEALNRAFRDPETDFIFDVSGGDLANAVLPYLDYEAVRNSRALFFGYSDLTTVLNAVQARTGRETVNYQIRNLLYDHSEEQLSYFRNRILERQISMEDLDIRFLRGGRMQGRILGGNIRCFLKLAGTSFWPELQGNILLLESLGGGVNQMITALQQYAQMGIFEKIQGILLGTFTRMEKDQAVPSMKEIVLHLVPERIPIAETRLIGHGTDARAVVLGREVEIQAWRETD